MTERQSSSEAHAAMKAYHATFRDRIASALANGVLNVLATRKYRDALNAVIRAGLIEAAKKSPNPPFTEPVDLDPEDDDDA